MKTLTIALLSTVTLVWAAGIALAGDPHLKPGLWEIHVKTVMQGMPFAPPPHTLKKCIKPEEANNPWRELQQNKAQKCRFSDLQIKGNRADWQMQCQGENTMAGKGFAVIDDPTHYHGSSDMTTKVDGNRMQIHVETTAHRTGSCP